MDPARWQKVCALFHDALEQPPERRSVFLRQACGEDRALIQDVGALLDNHLAASRFFEQPAVVSAADVLGFEGARDLLPGLLIGGRYHLRDEIGRGGFGVVYRASDERLPGKIVAVKILHEYWAASGWMRHRFEQEAEALSRINHPGIVSATDFGETGDGRMFLVMECIEGPTLRELLSRGPLPRAQAATIIRALGEALETAHDSGLLHRDLKPENVIAGARIKILDFGVARVSEPLRDGGATTVIAGTPDYMAPEQLLGRASRASDIYSLAMIAFEMITGRRIRQPNASGSGDLPPEMPAVVRQGLHPDETRRPRSARAYSEALAEVMLRPSRLGNSLRRRTLFSAGATALTALAAWRIRDYLGSPDVPASQRIVECPGIYPEEQYGFRAAYDIHSVVTTNENNTGRDRRRIWSGDMGQFYHTLTRSQRAQAWRKGFRLSAELLPEEGLITVLVDLAGFGPRFDLVAVRGASGETLAGIVRQVAPLHEFDLYPAGNRTPRLTLVGLVMNPENGLASVSIDGRTVARAYAGHRQFQEGHGLIIAVGRNRSERAAGVYRNVRLEIFP